jgi:hypothetical protein
MISAPFQADSLAELVRMAEELETPHRTRE